VAADADLLVRLVAPPWAELGLREAEPDAGGSPQETRIGGGQPYPGRDIPRFFAIGLCSFPAYVALVGLGAALALWSTARLRPSARAGCGRVCRMHDAMSQNAANCKIRRMPAGACKLITHSASTYPGNRIGWHFSCEGIRTEHPVMSALNKSMKTLKNRLQRIAVEALPAERNSVLVRPPKASSRRSCIC
jgi:hypothetical protein